MKQFKYLGFNDMGKATINSDKNALYAQLATGQMVWLDDDKPNRCKVKVISQTPRCMFTEVSNGSKQWEVLTYRLTPCS
jgi:hypothetical protein